MLDEIIAGAVIAVCAGFAGIVGGAIYGWKSGRKFATLERTIKRGPVRVWHATTTPVKEGTSVEAWVVSPSDPECYARIGGVWVGVSHQDAVAMTFQSICEMPEIATRGRHSKGEHFTVIERGI